jgi:adenosylcobinamide kinase/adenosylcobinamide-phosphate guanylyltransferase
MQHHTFVLGGARSGKTRRALALAEVAPQRVYIATAQAWDEEMQERISRHRRERDSAWTTIEAPVALADAISGASREAPDRPIVVDCLTLWLTNLMLGDHDIGPSTDELLEALDAAAAPVILVSNETGLGIVPDNKLARDFRDAQGILNQTVAAAVGTVEFVAAALPLRLKPARD